MLNHSKHTTIWALVLSASPAFKHATPTPEGLRELLFERHVPLAHYLALHQSYVLRAQANGLQASSAELLERDCASKRLTTVDCSCWKSIGGDRGESNLSDSEKETMRVILTEDYINWVEEL